MDTYTYTHTLHNYTYKQVSPMAFVITYRHAKRAYSNGRYVWLPILAIFGMPPFAENGLNLTVFPIIANYGTYLNLQTDSHNCNSWFKKHCLVIQLPHLSILIVPIIGQKCNPVTKLPFLAKKIVIITINQMGTQICCQFWLK